MTTYTYTDELQIMECCTCHCSFAMPQSLYEQARNDSGVWFYCPAGHNQHFTKSETTRLKAQLDQARADADWQRRRRAEAEADAQHQAAVARGYKGALTKTKKRIGRGVCPCCNRHFADVERHMASKHPEMVES